jgi:thioredoxin reductase (NADPH)
VEEALFLSRFARSVAVIHRRDRLRAAAFLQKRAFDNGKITFMWDSEVREILGRQNVAGVTVENLKNGSRRRINAEGIFIFIGAVPNSGFVKELVKLDENGMVITDISMRTSEPGVYAAGDVRKDSVRQIASSVGDGTTAIIQVERYLDLIYT